MGGRVIVSRIRLLMSALTLAFAVLSLFSGSVQGQEDWSVQWSEPAMLSDPASVLQMTALAADPWGGVHAFWVQGTAGDITQDAALNYIFYTHWDGEAWSTPNDIVVGPDWASYHYPEATVDVEGRIYLTWAGPTGLYFSTALITEAENAKSWTAPEVIAQVTRPGRSSMGVDPSGVLHLVYAQEEPGSNLLYLRTDDNGRTWSEPIPVSDLYAGDPQVTDLPDLAIDSHGGLHVVWAENYPPDWAGRQVYYCNSKDGGGTWSIPSALSESSVGTSHWNADANVAVDASDGVHVVWVCEVANRCYRRSDDGGQAWSGTQRVFGTLMGLSGHDDMAADVHGNVYWLGALREPQGVYFSELSTNEGWQDPPLLLIDESREGSLGQAHFFHLAVGQGNTLHAIMVAGDKGPVWYVRGQTRYPAMTSPPMPTAALTPEPTAVPTSVPAAMQPATETQPIGTEVPPAPISTGENALLWGLAPALLLIGIVIVASIASRRR